MTRKVGPLVAALLASVLVLTGCGAQQPGTDPGTQPDSSTAPGPEPAAPAEPEAKPVTQEETCDWDSPRLESGEPNAPSGQTGDVKTVLIGAWQHTHYDTGSGFEELDAHKDIRYVFPSTDRLLYCQDVAGATHQAENPVDMTLDGTEIILPSPATGYGVISWDANTMVWENHRDGSFYLLKRR